MSETEVSDEGPEALKGSFKALVLDDLVHLQVVVDLAGMDEFVRKIAAIKALIASQDATNAH